MRLAVGLLVTWLVFGAQSAKAGDCVPAGPPAKLDSESVDWTIVIASGQTCLRGFRSGAMILESVAISAPPGLNLSEVSSKNLMLVCESADNFR